jgi:3-hydroxyacyl-[acyl-carrier-protein] dehydratase
LPEIRRYGMQGCAYRQSSRAFFVVASALIFPYTRPIRERSGEGAPAVPESECPQPLHGAEGNMRFLLVDSILEWVLGKEAKGVKNVSLSEDFFDDHFPLKPIMPGTLIIEGMAQLSGILLEETMAARGEKVKSLLSLVERAKFRAPVYPGSQLIYSCAIEQINEYGGKISARALVAGELVAECALLFSFHTYNNPTQDAARRRILDVWLAGATIETD